MGRKGMLLLCALLLASAAVIFFTAVRTVEVPVIMAVGLLVSLWRGKPLERTARSLVYSFLAAFVGGYLVVRLFPSERVEFHLFPSQIYCPMLLFFGVALTFFEQSSINLTAIVGVAYLVTSLAAGAMNVPGNFTAVVAGVVLFQIPLYLLLLMRTTKVFLPETSRVLTGGQARRNTVFAVSVILAVMVTFGLRATFFPAYSQAQKTLSRLIEWQPNSFRFSRRSDLRNTMAEGGLAEKAVVLRVKSTQAPGYLRGYVFDLYKGGQNPWVCGEQSFPLMPVAGGNDHRRLKAFRCGPDHVPRENAGTNVVTMTICPSSQFSSPVLLVPGGAVECSLASSKVMTDLNGVLLPVDWSESSPYAVSRPAGRLPLPYAGPLEPGERFLQVPDDLRPRLAVLSKEIFSGGDNRRGGAADLARLATYFDRHFAYELGIDMKGSDDVVLQFLTRTRRGHCELFAAASVLLLRVHGIPARYVTGFVCLEQHPSRQYWVARVKCAHAWAEAYLAEEKRWVMVESTPASGIPSAETEFTAFSAFFDQLALTWQKWVEQFRSGQFAAMLRSLASGLAALLVDVFWHPVRGSLACVALVAAIGLRWRRRQRILAADSGLRLSRARQELDTARRRIERYLARRGVVRHPSWTLGELAETVRQTKPAGTEMVLSLLSDYEVLRYHREPELDAVREFNAKVRRILP